MTLKEAAYEANDASVRLFDPTTKRDVNHLNQSDGLDSAALSLAERTIESKLSKPLELTEGLARRMQVIQARPRRAAFRIAVKRLYGNRCAVCGSSLFAPDGEPEVESAHIYPKELDGSDDVRNGICLCRQHHWAFDVGWFAVSDDHRVIVREELPDTQDYQFIRKYAGRKIRLPSESDMAPHPEFLRRRRVLSGFP